MSNEWEKMLNGEPYDAANTEFIDRLFKTKDIIWEYNQLRPSDKEAREAVIRQLFGHCGKRPTVNSPFIVTMAVISMWVTISFQTST